MKRIILNRKMNIYSIESMYVNIIVVELLTLMETPLSGYLNSEGVTLATAFSLSLFFHKCNPEELIIPPEQ